MRLRTLISVFCVAVFAMLAFSITDSPHKQRTDSPPGIYLAQNVTVNHAIPSTVSLDQLPFSFIREVGFSVSGTLESERMVPASLALLSRSQSQRVTAKSLKPCKSEVRKTYVANIERFTGFVPRLT